MNENSEEEYISNLKQQKHMYRWCLENVGSYAEDEASEKAGAFYRYQPADEEYRFLVFHDDAWHWAMLHIKGEQYWKAFPAFAEATTEYELERKRYEQTQTSSLEKEFL